MRIRTIKPEFFTHDELFDLEKESGLPIRIAFAGLWCAADREGRFKWEPRRLGVQILPYDGIDFSRVLDALATRGFIRCYASHGGVFGVIPSFLDHQVINNREKESELPEPLEYIDCDACPTRGPRVPHAGKAEGKGREGKGKERKVAAKASGFDFSFPPEISESLKAALIKWQSYRREIKKPITATGWAALIRDCLECPTTMEDAINKSILSGWQGLFPDPSKSTEPEPAKSKPKTLPVNWREIGQLRYGRDFTGVEIEQLTYDEFGDIQRDCRFYADNPEQLAAEMANAEQSTPL
jgi:hypothetical protein